MRNNHKIEQGAFWDEKRPRDYAAEIGESMRTYFKEQMKEVPPEYREWVTDLVINGMAISLSKRKAKRNAF